MNGADRLDLPIRRRRRRTAPLFPNLSILLLGFLGAGAGGAAAYFLPLVVTTAATVAASASLPDPGLNPPTGDEKPFTVLLLGSDDDSKFPSDRVLTQSMILVRVDPAGRQATLLSIPRDLWVSMPGRSAKLKIDQAYEIGGPQAAVAAVESNFRVHVDDYVWIGLKGLIHLIDRLGGVDVQVTNPVLDDFYPDDIDSRSPYGYYRVAVLPGAAHLDGAQALQYVRSRHGDLRGDFGRSERQQQVLLALRSQSRRLNAADLPDLVGAFNGEIKTSLAVDRVRQLLAVADRFGTGGVRQVVLLPPYTSTAHVADQDVVLPNWELILPLVHQTFP